LLPAIAKTYAPCGETPILRVPCTYDHLSAMSGVTLHEQLFTLVRTEALTGVDSVQFLRHIQHQVGVNLLAIWDGSPIHRSAVVKSFLADGGATTIHLEQLPPYAPDLNPDEGVWHLLKDVQLRVVVKFDW
jgi:transposase